MNSLTRIMSFDKTKVNQKCDCVDCVSVENAESNNRITKYPKLSEEEIEQIISERYFNKDEKTKTFIRKALRKHGDRYDYSNVNYVNAHTKIEIICRVEGHKPFPMTPNNHLNGNGCKNVYPLRFDFYLPKYNLCIESDGNPHSEKINWNGKLTNEQMEKELKLNQKRDDIKNEYCKKNGIALLRVNNLKAYEELTEYFQNL